MEDEDITRLAGGKFLKYSRKPAGERPLGREKLMFENVITTDLMFENVITTDLKETACEEVYQTHRRQAEDQWWVPLNTAMNPPGLFPIHVF
jgi:hypothetical protein